LFLASAVFRAIFHRLPSRQRGGLPTLLCTVLCALLATACASLPAPAPKTASSAFRAPEQTTLGRIALDSSPKAGASGFQLETTGDQAFDDRLTLIDRAERSLDLQYYIIERDDSVHTLFTHVRQAARRGVRVRLLVDDMNTVGLDLAFLRIDALPNIEVRIFNPFPAARFSIASRFLASLGDFRRVSRRMHNKMLIADNAIAITGGRNLGDQYFVRNPDNNFVDLDIVSAGPVVRQLSASFDRYWNDELAYPIKTIAAAPGTSEVDDAARQGPAALPPPESLRSQLGHGRLDFTWAPVTLLADRPSKITSKTSHAPPAPTAEPGPSVPTAAPTVASTPAPAAASDELIIDDIATLIRSAQHELVIISPYLVPGQRGVALLHELTARGVKIRILTNSLASTDAPAVHIGYARYRPQLLALGVELYEQRPLIEGQSRHFGRFGASRSSLHTKALIIDGKMLFVGSMNMDPRSAYENTELGLVLRSELMARQVLKLFNEESSRFSYRVQLSADGRQLIWSTQTKGQHQQWLDEPGAGLGLKLELLLLRPFAPEELL